MIPLYTKEEEKKLRTRCEEALVNRKNLIITFVSYLNENSRRMENENKEKQKKDYCEKRDSLNHKD